MHTHPLCKGHDLSQISYVVHWLAACGLAFNGIILLSHDCVSACNNYDKQDKHMTTAYAMWLK